MISRQDILAASSANSLIEIRELDLSNRGLKLIEPCSFTGLANLKHLDLSRNELRTVPDLNLPKLQKLNIEENLVQDLTFLRFYNNLTDLWVVGNPLTSADRSIAVSLLPKLTSLDGSDCLPLKKLEACGDKKLLPQIIHIWESYFDNRLTPGLNKDDIDLLKKDFLRQLRRAFIDCNKFPAKFKKFKIELLGKELFEEKVLQLSNRLPSTPRKNSKASSARSGTSLNTPRRSLPNSNERELPSRSESARRKPCFDASPKNTPSKQSTPLKSYLMAKALNGGSCASQLRCSPRKRAETSEPQEKITVPPKRSLREAFSPKKDVSQASKEPLKGAEILTFLRCHSRNADDSATQVWQAAFEPSVVGTKTVPSIVATCGGRVVNFIDCSTGVVVKRYRHSNPKEELFCLAWSVVPIEGKLNTILAVAGKACEVSLLHPQQLVCYHSFHAHSKYINCLTFCPSRPTWLLSGSLDNKIHLWDIGVPVLPSYSTRVEKLVTLQPNYEVLQMRVSAKHHLLLAACHGGLFAWDFDEDSVMKLNRTPAVEFQLPGSSGTRVEKEPVVDGLVLTPHDLVVTKCSGSGMIGAWSLVDNLKSKEKHARKIQRIRVKYQRTYEWSNTNVDYFYPSATSDTIACGDDNGTIWLYKLNEAKVSQVAPLKTLLWPEALKCNGFTVEKKENKVNVNAVTLSPDDTYLVACTDVNVVCIWKLLH